MATLSNDSLILLNNSIQFSTINGTYTIPIVAFIGFVLNLITLIVLTNSKLQNKIFYKFFIVKVTLELFQCLIGIAYLNISSCLLEANNICSDKGIYFFQFFKAYVFIYSNAVIFSGRGLNEIYLLYDRYLILVGQTNWFNKKENFKYIIGTSCLISVMVYLPLLFVFNVEPGFHSNGLYFIEISAFGSSLFIKVFGYVSLVLSNIIYVLSAVVLNVIVSVKFKKFLRLNSETVEVNLNAQTNDEQRVHIEDIFKNNRQTERKMFMLTLILNVIFCVSRFLESVVVLVIQELISNSPAVFYVDSVYNILLYLFLWSNFFVLIVYNNEFRHHFQRIYIWAD